MAWAGMAGWQRGRSDLAGNGGQLVDVLARVPTGRLVVLGEPGTGKTVLMVRLVLDLLARRESGRAQRVVH
jgi:predicted NACHT family NTPase